MKKLFFLFMLLGVIAFASCGNDSQPIPAWASEAEQDSVFIQFKNGNSIRVSRKDFQNYTWDASVTLNKRVKEIENRLGIKYEKNAAPAKE